jgi:hypothetical protein
MSSAATLTGTIWRKSSYSTENGGACLEVADGIPGTVPVRDSKAPDGPALLIPAHAWTAFVGALKGDGLPKRSSL